MAFDALVMSNPLQAKTTDLTPEALSAFRTSQRLMPPSSPSATTIARSRAASGDPDRALALAREAMTIIDRASPMPPLGGMQDLVEEAKLAAGANEIIYSEEHRRDTPAR
jgi:hypothetical protein